MNDYLQGSPKLLGRGDKGGVKFAIGHLWMMLRRFLRAAWQALLPFNPHTEVKKTLPLRTSPPQTPTDAQLAQCQWIFDQCEARATHLEQKAQWAFAIIIFVIPIIASAFGFFLALDSNGSGWARCATLWLLGVSAVLLLLGFLSVVRALAVKHRASIFLDAVINPADGSFRVYDVEYHARGLLHCATVNSAMNDHLAQFVRGGHLLSGCAVIALAIAAVPASMEFIRTSETAAKIRSVTPVEVSVVPDNSFVHELADVRNAFEAEIATVRDAIRLLGERLTESERRLESLTSIVAPTTSPEPSPQPIKP